MTTLADIIGGGAHSGRMSAIEAPRPLPEAQIEGLRGYLHNYLNSVNVGCPFHVGELVTPRKTSPLFPGNGTPWIVVEVLTNPYRLESREPNFIGHPGPGKLIDFRVAAVVGGDGTIESWANSSYEFEPYTGADIDTETTKAN